MSALLRGQASCGEFSRRSFMSASFTGGSTKVELSNVPLRFPVAFATNGLYSPLLTASWGGHVVFLSVFLDFMAPAPPNLGIPLAFM